MPTAPRTALVVPVPAAEPVVGRVRRRFDPSAAHGVDPHVTLVVPFLPIQRIGAGVRAELRERFAAAQPFAFELARLDSFPSVVYLAPEPAGPFVELTLGLAERYGTRPYEGIHRDVVPHLTVAMEDGENVTALVEECVQPHLPVSARAEQVLLLAEQADGHWLTEERFGLGG